MRYSWGCVRKEASLNSAMSPSSQIRLLLVLAFGVIPAGCTYVTKEWITPGVNLAGIRPSQMTAEGQTFIVTLAVNNPNDRTLPIKGASYSLALEGEEIARGSGSLDEQIPAFSEGLVNVEVNTDFMELLQRAPALALRDGPLRYEITGVLKLAGGFVPVPFRYAGEMEASTLMREMVSSLSR
jgi:LEA14-like dessication related protein